MGENKLHSTYTIAAVPNTKKKGRIGPVAPIPTASPYTLDDAKVLADMWTRKHFDLINSWGFSHFVAFNLEALTMDPPPWYLDRDDD